MTIEWTVENEIQLFYAMMNHKPVGINKHFQMLAIHNKLTSSLNCDVDAKDIWEKLDTLYDLQALDESDKLPFPNEEEDFALPQDTFATLLETRAQQNNSLDNIEEPSRSKPTKHSLRKDDKEEVLNGRKEKGKENHNEEDDIRDTPRRSLKRTRESLNAKNSPSPATSKRRR